MFCRCRYCHKKYDINKSRSDYTGYCSQKCLNTKAKELGWKGNENSSPFADKSKSLYAILHDADQIGNIPIFAQPIR